MDLSQIQNLPLHHPAIIEPPIFHDVPIDVCFAVLLSSGLAQKHDGANLAAQTRTGKWGRSSLQPISAIFEKTSPANSIACARPAARKSLIPAANPRSRASEALQGRKAEQQIGRAGNEG